MSGNSLAMIDLSDALQKVGFLGSNKIDILSLETCLMNMLEAYETSKHARLIVGSEELEPPSGWRYADLESLNSPKIDEPNLVTELVKSYDKSYCRVPYNNDQYWPVT